MSNRKKLRLAYIFLVLGGFIASALPVLIVLILRWDSYTKTPSDTVKLCAGGIICLLFVGLKVIGKLKFPSRAVAFAVVFVLAWLLDAIMDDIILISGMALLGEAVDGFIFQPFIRHIKSKIAVEKTADATTEKVKELFEQYVGSGRT